jgi:hypothetical protein
MYPDDRAVVEDGVEQGDLRLGCLLDCLNAKLQRSIVERSLMMATKLESTSGREARHRGLAHL